MYLRNPEIDFFTFNGSYVKSHEKRLHLLMICFNFGEQNILLSPRNPALD